MSNKVPQEPFRDHHRVPLARPLFDDLEVDSATAVIRSGMLCQGEKTAEFEERFSALLGIEHAVAVSSGSSALLVALQALGVGRDDEVIVPDMTFISTATAAMYLGATPILCDITETDYGIDPARIEALITDRTKAIVPVHYAGQTAEMEPILDVAHRHGLHVLEDAAEAHLARYRGEDYAGTLGDIGIFSFTPTKPMTTGEGGMIVTRNADLADACRSIRNFGDEGKFAWHSLGFNFRLTDVAAAMGVHQVDKLPALVEGRVANARYYDQAFADEPAIVTPWTRTPTDCNYQLYTIAFDIDQLSIDRDAIVGKLTERGVSSRLYYPALHNMRVFGPENCRAGTFPVADRYELRALSIPVFAGVTDDQRQYVAESILDIVASHRR